MYIPWDVPSNVMRVAISTLPVSLGRGRETELAELNVLVSVGRLPFNVEVGGCGVWLMDRCEKDDGIIFIAKTLYHPMILSMLRLAKSDINSRGSLLYLLMTSNFLKRWRTRIDIHDGKPLLHFAQQTIMEHDQS